MVEIVSRDFDNGYNTIITSSVFNQRHVGRQCNKNAFWIWSNKKALRNWSFSAEWVFEQDYFDRLEKLVKLWKQG